ncbi:prostaglandin F synthase 1-like isoform X4 [Acinonyx jubatus]|uniref:Prostaglandin F synthase 1-like isoform X4 n=1 Tax=Acinonyx jubatus TaxID=32536 RepID=A0ABM3QB91_ACIJB|nr:prostaglandin F synthase 1-like isoform X4 [Acinonyx jubatus]
MWTEVRQRRWRQTLRCGEACSCLTVVQAVTSSESHGPATLGVEGIEKQERRVNSQTGKGVPASSRPAAKPLLGVPSGTLFSSGTVAFDSLVYLTRSSLVQDCDLEFLISLNKKPEEWKGMSSVKLCSVKLNDGFFMPMLGFGTSAPNKVAKSEVEEAVMRAIDVGYRHFDSAYLYLNEEEIGRAIRKKITDGSVKREDIFYTSKVWGTFLRPELVRTSLEISLSKLQLSYVDLYLIHIPIPLKPGEELFPKDEHGELIFDTVDLCATWEVECHPYLNQSKLLEFCKSQDIVLTAYAALGSNSGKEWLSKNNPVLLEDPVLSAIAARHRRTPAQVALRYQLQRGVVALAKSFNEERIRENFQVLDFQLTPEDMESLDSLNRNIRYFVDPLVNRCDGVLCGHPQLMPLSLCLPHQST